MSDEPAAVLRTHHRHADTVVASLRGDLTLTSAVAVQKALTALLTEHSGVLLDISGVALTWAPAPELFVSAVAAAGGWPSARLVLVGADQPTTNRLRACRVAESIPLAATERDAWMIVADRPARLLRSERFPGHHSSVSRACEFVADVCRQWDVPDPDGQAASIVGELAADAARSGHVGFRVRVVLEGGHLRISVRDHGPGPVGPPRTPAARTAPGMLAALGVAWGELQFDDGTSVWAVLDLEPSRRSPATIAHRRANRPTAGPTATAVARQHFVSYDVEQAHEFLSSRYSRHSPRLTGSRTGFQLEFSATGTSSFAMERVSHNMAVHGRFEPCPDLFVTRPLGGRFRIRTRHASYETAPGDVLLVGPDEEHEIDWTELDVEAIRLDPAAVAAVAADVYGVDARTVRFELARPVSTVRARHWLSTTRLLRDGVLGNADVLASPLTRAVTFRYLATTLVETFPNPALNALIASTTAGPGRVEPAVVRRAAVFIEEHAGEDIGLGDIARAARVGPRALQMAFRRYRDTTPLEHLRRVRLERAHRELLAADPAAGDTVALIADRWGFAHHGYFAASYRRAYGRSPHVTLRS